MATTAAELIALESPSKLMAHAIGNSQSMTIYADGGFSAFYDDYDSDTRIVVRYRGNYTRYDVAVLHDYNAEKHCWASEGGTTSVELPNRRGAAWCKTTHRQMAEMQGHLYPGSKTVHLYRNADGGWK